MASSKQLKKRKMKGRLRDDGGDGQRQNYTRCKTGFRGSKQRCPHHSTNETKTIANFLSLVCPAATTENPNNATGPRAWALQQH